MRLELTVSQDKDGSVRFAAEIDNQEPHSIVREFHYPLVGDEELHSATACSVYGMSSNCASEPANENTAEISSGVMLG